MGFHDEALTAEKTIVIGRKGSIGEVHVSSKPCWPIDTTYYIDSTATDADLSWLSQALVSLRLTELNRAAAVPGLNRSDAYEKRLFVPRAADQRRIAAILDKADALRRNHKRALDLLDEMTQAVFLTCFGDSKTNSLSFPISTLGEIADFYSGNSLPDGEEFKGQADGFLLLKVSDLGHAESDTVVKSAASWRAKPGTKAGTCFSHAVVFPKRGGAIATNRKRKLLRPAIFDPNLMAVAPRSDVLDLEYLFGWFQQFKLEEISSGSSVPQLNKQDLYPLPVILPPLERQKNYSAACTRIGTQRDKLLRATASESMLFASLQHRAFTGQL